MNFKVNYDLVHDGIKFFEGDVLGSDSFTKKQKKRLLNIGVVSECHEEPNVEIREEKLDQPGLADGGIAVAPLKIDETYGELVEVELTDEDVRKELDDGFTHTELVKEMEVLEMNFKKNDSKEKLIGLILDEEKDEHFLDLLEGR